MESISVVTITERELENHLEAATAKVFSFSFLSPKREPEPSAQTTLGGRRFSFRPLQNVDGVIPSATAQTMFNLAETIQKINPRDDLYTDTEHHVLREVRRAIQVYLQIYQYYEQASGLERLKLSNKAGQLGKEQESELKSKTETASSASLFALAHFLIRKLEGYRSAEVESLSFEVDPPVSLLVNNQTNALHSALFYLHDAIERQAKDDVSLVKVILSCARELAQRISTTRESLRFVEFYTRYHYRIEPEGIHLSGFDLEEPVTSSQVEVQEKRPEEVVGNHIAKFEAMRLAPRLVCYDLERQRNPFVDLGGFTFTLIGDGSPGTGKTTLIQMTVTLLKEYCGVVGLPFRYLNFSVDEISDYQGRSGQNAKRFCREVLDPKSIGFGTIDDVDQVCGNRNDKNASAGQLEVTALFMQEFAGPNTVVRGNSTFALFSNYPEKVDDALRQRTQARFLVDGPQTQEDFTDLLFLLLGSNWTMPLGSGYESFTTQQVRKVIQAKYAEHDRPRSAALSALFEKHAKDGKIRTWIEFGEYLHSLKEREGRFTGRAVKNIADAVRFRVMDFDLPQEWFVDPKSFFAKAYETKLEMLKELRGQITPEIVLQEINRYADSEERYAAAAGERELSLRTSQIVLEARARSAAASELA